MSNRKPAPIRDMQPSSSDEEEASSEPDEYEPKPKPKASKVVKAVPLKIRTKPVPVKAVKTEVPLPVATIHDVKVGFVYTKTGKRQLYETPSKKYYIQRDDGSRTYVTARINAERLKVYES